MQLVHEVRRAIYAALVRSERPPEPADLALEMAVDQQVIADIYHALADAHVIVLRPGTVKIAWAPPFSAVPTPFRAMAGPMSWHAPCAWDAFGIPAALKGDAVIDARCAWSGGRIACGVEGGAAYGSGVIHLLVPAAHFWDDIAYT
jgi:Alkylmercury lyase